MAITFISPQRQQRIIRNIIILLLFLSLFIIPFVVFSSLSYEENKDFISNEISKPNFKINFDILDSEQVKNLEVFETMQTEFIYSALGKDNKNVNGKILAYDKYEAEKILKGMNIKVFELKESNLGKVDPFSPYSQSTTKK